jgi:CheY-like chemotaxis protein
MRNSNPILLIEDDRVDAMTLKRALNDQKVVNPLVQVTNGEEALEYLRNDDNQKPSLILLDLNMPKMNGVEFLKIVKADETLRNIPIVVLTTSTEERDIAESFKQGAAGYMVKSVDYKKFVETITAIDVYWSLSELPIRG